MEHFTISEFNCNCCGTNGMNQHFLNRLDIARDIANIPFKIISGYRCPAHNKKEGGSPTSTHPEGKGADIEVNNSVERFIIIDALLKAGFKRMGVSHDFIHVDDGTDKDQYVIWVY